MAGIGSRRARTRQWRAQAGREAAASCPSVMDIWVRALGLTAAAVDNHPGRILSGRDRRASSAQHGAATGPACRIARRYRFRHDLDRRARTATAGWALDQGLGKATDVVALMMPNRPDYLAAWIGITRVGAYRSALHQHQPSTGPFAGPLHRGSRRRRLAIVGQLRCGSRGARPNRGARNARDDGSGCGITARARPSSDRRLDGALRGPPRRPAGGGRTSRTVIDGRRGAAASTPRAPPGCPRRRTGEPSPRS